MIAPLIRKRGSITILSDLCVSLRISALKGAVNAEDAEMRRDRREYFKLVQRVRRIAARVCSSQTFL